MFKIVYYAVNSNMVEIFYICIYSLLIENSTWIMCFILISPLHFHKYNVSYYLLLFIFLKVFLSKNWFVIMTTFSSLLNELVVLII